MGFENEAGRRPRRHEPADGHAFKRNRQKECAQMRRKNRHFSPKNAALGSD
jgi:hypothetical protein